MEEENVSGEGEETGGRAPAGGETVRIESLGVNSRSVNAVVKVVEKKDERDVVSRMDGATHKVAEFLVGDQTGSIIMSLWDDAIGQVEVGRSYQIENARVIVFNNSMRLSPGRLGKITPVSEDIEANVQNNVSEKHVERPFRRSFGGGGSGGFGRGRGGGGEGRGFRRERRF